MAGPEVFTRDPHWPAGAECLFEPEAVARALDAQAERLAEITVSGGVFCLVALMKGGMYPAVELSRRLPGALRLDYVHATRYREDMQGGEIDWVHWPDNLAAEDHIVLVDDIFDEGHTMKAVVDRLREQGVERLTTAVLTRKQHDRGLDRDWVDDAALEIPDRYVFGCGMDYRGLWRQLDAIWAIAS